MTLSEIKAAVDAGQTVYWENPGYLVEKWDMNRLEPSYNIVFQENRYAVGLTHQDGVTMNGREDQFFILDEDVDSAYLEDVCPDCGSEVDWDLSEASTGGDTYRGTCRGCESVFIAEFEAQLKEVRRE